MWCVFPWKMVSEVRCGPHPRHGAARRNTPRARTPPTPATTAAQRRSPTWPTKWWPWGTIWWMWKDVKNMSKGEIGWERKHLRWNGWGPTFLRLGGFYIVRNTQKRGLVSRKLRDKPAKHLSESWTWLFLVTGEWHIWNCNVHIQHLLWSSPLYVPGIHQHLLIFEVQLLRLSILSF